MKTIEAKTKQSQPVNLVGDIIKPRSCLVFSPKEKVSYMVRKMQGHHSAAAGVADATGRLIGMVTEREILRRLFETPPETLEQQRFVDEDKPVMDLTAWDVMIASPKCLNVNTAIEDALEQINNYGFRYMPVIGTEQGERLVGICGECELLQYVREKANREIEAKNSLLSYFMHHEPYGSGAVLE